MTARGLSVLALALSFAACDRKPVAPPVPPKPAHPVPPRPTPVPHDLPVQGISLKFPPCWSFSEGKPSSSFDGVLLEFKCGTELMGQLHWMTGGTDPRFLSDLSIKNVSSRYKDSILIKRQAFIGDGVRVDLRTYNNVPDSLRWTIIHFFHRGRLFDLLIWCHPSNWYLHAQEVEDLVKGIELVHPDGQPLLSGSVVSTRHGYRLELPTGWSLLEVDPPEGRIVSRFWTGPGLPGGMVLQVDAPGSASEYMTRYLQLPETRERLEGEPKVSGSGSDVAAEMISKVGGKFRHVTRILAVGKGFLHCEVWAPLDAGPEIHSALDRITRSLKLQ